MIPIRRLICRSFAAPLERTMNRFSPRTETITKINWIIPPALRMAALPVLSLCIAGMLCWIASRSCRCLGVRLIVLGDYRQVYSSHMDESSMIISLTHQTVHSRLTPHKNFILDEVFQQRDSVCSVMPYLLVEESASRGFIEDGKGVVLYTAPLTRPAFQRRGCPEPTSPPLGRDLCFGWLQEQGTRECRTTSRS